MAGNTHSIVKPVSTQQVTVQTASVSIRIICVGAKQMTLSMFRQLPVQCLFDDYTLDGNTLLSNGSPWGRVNYFWPQCESGESYLFNMLRCPHYHVVWEADGMLCRDCIPTVDTATRWVWKENRGKVQINKYKTIEDVLADTLLDEYQQFDLSRVIAFRNTLEKYINPLPQLYIAV